MTHADHVFLIRMTVAWPGMLWLLVLVPALAALFVRSSIRRRKGSLRSASLLQLRDAAGHGPGFRRHLPEALLLLGMTVLILALARPSATMVLPAHRGTVILSVDVSGSMRAKDIAPTRMQAVKDAAIGFVKAQSRGVQIGVVAFSGMANLVQAPTADKDKVVAAIERLSPQMFTAIGSGLLTALEAIFPKQPAAGADSTDSLLTHTPEEPGPPPVAPGSYSSAAIILLSDGQSNQGPNPLDAADKAADLGVRVFTIGVGTKEGVDLSFGGFTFHAILDEATLQKIALVTGGRYFKASSAEELRAIYTSLGARVVLEPSMTELTALLVGAALLLFLLMGALSMMWFNRLL
jgi:Ca-activated chloride channel family protein